MKKAERQRLWDTYKEEWDKDGKPIFTYRRMYYHPVNCPACLAVVVHLHDKAEPVNRDEYVAATIERFRQWLSPAHLQSYAQRLQEQLSGASGEPGL